MAIYVKYTMNWKSLFSINTIAVMLVSFCSDGLWAQVWKPLGLGTESITAIVIDWSNPSIIYCGSGSNFSSSTVGGIFKSTDAGFSWDTLLRGVTLHDLDIDPHNTSILYATLGLNFLTQPGIIKTTDGGHSWASSDSGIYKTSEEGPQVLAINPEHSDTLYCGSGGFYGGRFYKSTNGGRNWQSLGDSTQLRGGVWALAIDPVNTNTIYAGAASLLRSTDGGADWRVLGLVADFGPIEFDEENSAIYAGGFRSPASQVGIFRTTDSGQTWANPTSGLPDTLNVTSIQVYSGQKGHRVFLAGQWGSAGGVYESSDGQNWNRISNDDPGVSTLMISGENLYGGANGVYLSEIVTSVNQSDALRRSFALEQNYPNPFNPTTTIQYQLRTAGEVHLEVYSLLGKRVKSLISQSQTAGWRSIVWDGRNDENTNVSSGVYFYILRLESAKQVRKMILLK